MTSDPAPTAPVGVRDAIAEWYRAGSNIALDDALLGADGLIAALHAKGYEIVDADDVEEAARIVESYADDRDDDPEGEIDDGTMDAIDLAQRLRSALTDGADR